MKISPAVEKNADHQIAIPKAWRSTLAAIVQALVEADFELTRGVASVQPVPKDLANHLRDSIRAYGCQLISLPELSWNTSVCQWMGSHWELMVDLYSREEGASDLVLSVRAFEAPTGHAFEILSVHVP